MIINCEQCQARYLLASLLLGASGRKVKCGVCGHEWFQEPVDEPYVQPQSFSEHLEHEVLDPIPEGVKPIPEGSSVPVFGKPKFSFNLRDHADRRTIGGGLAAAAIFVFVLSSMIVLHGPLAKAWPPFALLFDSMGLETPIAGQDLIFDHVTAKAALGKDGKPALTLAGNIINIKNAPSEVPGVWANLQKSATEKGATFMVKLDQKFVPPRGTIPFTMVYDNLPDDMKEVKINFAPGASPIASVPVVVPARQGGFSSAPVVAPAHTEETHH